MGKCQGVQQSLLCLDHDSVRELLPSLEGGSPLPPAHWASGIRRLHRDQAPSWPGHPHRAAGMGATAAHLSYTFSTERLSLHPTRALIHSLNKCQSFASAPGSLPDPGGTAADKELTA